MSLILCSVPWHLSAVCMYVQMRIHVRMCVRMHVYAFLEGVCTCTCTPVCVHVHMCTCTCVCTCDFVQVCVCCSCMHVYMLHVCVLCERKYTCKWMLSNCRIEGDSKSYPLIFAYLEDPGLQGDFWGAFAYML